MEHPDRILIGGGLPSAAEDVFMEQRLRLVPSGHHRREKRVSDRRALRVSGQLVWKDSRGATRLARIVTRDVSDRGVAVDCVDGSAIPLYRLVYVQLDREVRKGADDLPEALRRPVLSAVYRVGPCQPSTGAPVSYALRLMVEPAPGARSSRSPKTAYRSA
jgi:hypothetical protein